MKRIICAAAFAALLSVNTSAASLISTALVTMGFEPTNCVPQSSSGTASASATMEGCTDAPPGFPYGGADSYTTTVSVKTAFGDSHIYYEGGSEIDRQYAAGTSQYSYTLGFAGRGVKELFAEYMITTDVAIQDGSCPWGLSLSVFVGKSWPDVTPCQGTDHAYSDLLTIDLGAVNTSQPFNLVSGLFFSAYGEVPLQYGSIFEAQLQGFMVGPVGGSPEQPIASMVLPEPGTALLLVPGAIALLIMRMRARPGICRLRKRPAS